MDVIGVGGINFEDHIARFSSRGMTTWVSQCHTCISTQAMQPRLWHVYACLQESPQNRNGAMVRVLASHEMYSLPALHLLIKCQVTKL